MSSGPVATKSDLSGSGISGTPVMSLNYGRRVRFCAPHRRSQEGGQAFAVASNSLTSAFRVGD